MSLRPVVIVHGGAGSYDGEGAIEATAGLERAARFALTALASGSALDAVQVAVRVLEDDPSFNAGVGAVLTRDGTVELDASIMDGSTLRFGAVAAVPNLRQPIDLARAVLEDGEHVLLCAEGAWRFARERGISPCDPGELITQDARERLAAEKSRRERGALGHVDLGTVGACALDRDGHVASATSTGGMTYKRMGRIGDTPLCGCGTFADNRGGAASATGAGEAIIRVTMAAHCVACMRRGASASEAAWSAVAELGQRASGKGGIICVDARGRIGAAHNAPRMAWAAATLVGERIAILSDMMVGDGGDVMERLAAAAS